MKILVTGINGAVGGNLFRLFGKDGSFILDGMSRQPYHLLKLNHDINTYNIDLIQNSPEPSFFDKYDVAGDPRNIVRELRSGVYETGTTRGYNESQRLLTRTLDDRWLPRGYASTTGIDTYLYYTKGRR